MSEDLIIGAVAGAGWGVFLGFFLGVAWLRAFVREMASPSEKNEGTDDA